MTYPWRPASGQHTHWIAMHVLGHGYDATAIGPWPAESLNGWRHTPPTFEVQTFAYSPGSITYYMCFACRHMAGGWGCPCGWCRRADFYNLPDILVPEIRLAPLPFPGEAVE